MNSFNKGKISHILQIINVVPLFIFGIIMILLSSDWFTRTMYAEVEMGLENVANNIITTLDVAYPGDYHLKSETVNSETAYLLYKGDHDLTMDYNLIDRFKKDTDMDVTLFYQDTRILTTLTNSSGTRLIGSGAPEIIIKEVLNTGESHFYNNVFIYGTEYFALYMPLHNSDGSVIGMIFVGKPTEQVNTAIYKTVYPLAIVGLIVVLITAILVFLYTKSFVSVLSKIHYFLTNVSLGNLNTELDTSVLRRNDELGDIGRSALTMQRSLRNMVDQDPLTELFNRRSGDRKLQQIIQKSSKQETPFCVALGDIDYFKNINDTYGHDCGDMILQTIADKLRTHMFDCGFVARWGGEEFLLVFDHTDIEESHLILQKLLDDIRTMECSYDGHTIKVTMTFGLMNGNSTDHKQLIRQADEKLYIGKSTGRNQIIV